MASEQGAGKTCPGLLAETRAVAPTPEERRCCVRWAGAEPEAASVSEDAAYSVQRSSSQGAKLDMSGEECRDAPSPGPAFEQSALVSLGMAEGQGERLDSSGGVDGLCISASAVRPATVAEAESGRHADLFLMTHPSRRSI